MVSVVCGRRFAQQQQCQLYVDVKVHDGILQPAPEVYTCARSFGDTWLFHRLPVEDLGLLKPRKVDAESKLSVGSLSTSITRAIDHELMTRYEATAQDTMRLQEKKLYLDPDVKAAVSALGRNPSRILAKPLQLRVLSCSSREDQA